VWFVWWGGRGPYPPGKETNIAFILRSGPGEFPKTKDDQLCFLMNNGQYIGHKAPVYPFVNALDDATGFAFPGHDIHHLPTAFTDALQNMQSGGVLNIYFGLFASIPEWPATSFTMSQVTPPPSSIQASGKGDGLDFSWVDLTDTTWGTPPTNINDTVYNIYGGPGEGELLLQANLWPAARAAG
jgi:hypothetical protein